MHDEFFKQLIRDHNEVKGILSQMVDSEKITERQELKKQIEKALVPHMKAEESIFYPVLKEKKDSRDLALEALEEHHVAELVLNEVLNLRPENEIWKAKCNVLQELLEHHIDEEETRIFKISRDLISEEQIAKMLTSFSEEKIWFTTRITGM